MCSTGEFRVTLFGSNGRWRQETLSQGDVGYIPQGFGHSIENIGGATARILIVFNTGHYQTIDLSQWIAGNSVDVLATNSRMRRPSSKSFRAGRVQLVGEARRPGTKCSNCWQSTLRHGKWDIVKPI